MITGKRTRPVAFVTQRAHSPNSAQPRQRTAQTAEDPNDAGPKRQRRRVQTPRERREEVNRLFAPFGSFRAVAVRALRSLGLAPFGPCVVWAVRRFDLAY